LSNSLFHEDSYYSLNNVSFKNIKTNSKAVMVFYQNDVDINGMKVENIQCVGDIDKTSFLLFDSGEVFKTINIKNLLVENSVSNGPFIIFKGEKININIKDSQLHNIKSYGSIMKNYSKQVY